jgi:hypothetical protein
VICDSGLSRNPVPDVSAGVGASGRPGFAPMVSAPPEK